MNRHLSPAVGEFAAEEVSRLRKLVQELQVTIRYERDRNLEKVKAARDKSEQRRAALEAMLRDYRSEYCNDPDCKVCPASKAAQKAAQEAVKT